MQDAKNARNSIRMKEIVRILIAIASQNYIRYTWHSLNLECTLYSLYNFILIFYEHWTTNTKCICKTYAEKILQLLRYQFVYAICWYSLRFAAMQGNFRLDYSKANWEWGGGGEGTWHPTENATLCTIFHFLLHNEGFRFGFDKLYFCNNVHLTKPLCSYAIPWIWTCC